MKTIDAHRSQTAVPTFTESVSGALCAPPGGGQGKGLVSQKGKPDEYEKHHGHGGNNCESRTS